MAGSEVEIERSDALVASVNSSIYLVISAGVCTAGRLTGIVVVNGASVEVR